MKTTEDDGKENKRSAQIIDLYLSSYCLEELFNVYRYIFCQHAIGATCHRAAKRVQQRKWR